MKKWEYKQIDLDIGEGDDFNILGEMGWEAYHVSKEKEFGYKSSRYYVTIYLKREIETNLPPINK